MQAFRTFNIQPKNDQVVFATIDAGASETGFFFGILRQAKPDERGDGYERMIEYLEPKSAPSSAASAWPGSPTAPTAQTPPPYRRPAHPSSGPGRSGTFQPADLLVHSPEARANVVILKDWLRPRIEQSDRRPRLRVLRSPPRHVSTERPTTSP